MHSYDVLQYFLSNLNHYYPEQTINKDSSFSCSWMWLFFQLHLTAHSDPLESNNNKIVSWHTNFDLMPCESFWQKQKNSVPFICIWICVQHKHMIYLNNGDVYSLTSLVCTMQADDPLTARGNHSAIILSSLGILHTMHGCEQYLTDTAVTNQQLRKNKYPVVCHCVNLIVCV